jgi:ABC-type phosphate transport system substrate-binding protein
MEYKIRLGIPEMESFWQDITQKADTGALSGNEEKLFKKLAKALNLLRNNPKHNSLATHEIQPLSRRYGMKVWQSYLDTRTPAAGRLFWVYGPGKSEITIIGLEPHPEDKKRAGYEKVRLSELP